jgi:hypothetical protein
LICSSTSRYVERVRRGSKRSRRVNIPSRREVVKALSTEKI